MHIKLNSVFTKNRIAAILLSALLTNPHSAEAAKKVAVLEKLTSFY